MKRILYLTLITLFSTVTTHAQYKIGDYYEKEGIKGIVVKVDTSGEHGLIMSLDRFKGEWCTDKKLNFETKAFHEDDGKKIWKLLNLI